MTLPPTFKKAILILVGICGINLGLFLAYAATKMLWSSRPDYRVTVIVSILMLLFLWMGIRAFRIGLSSSYAAKPRVQLWKIALGVFVINNQLGNEYWPSPGLKKADNFDQAIGMNIAMVLFLTLAGWLIISGIRARRSQNVALHQ